MRIAILSHVLVIGAVCLGESACTLASETGSTQCRSESDCLARGPAFVDTTCSPERVCVQVPRDSRLCSTNKECLERLGEPSRCLFSEGRCVPLLSTECPRFRAEANDLANDEAVYIGLVCPPNVDGQLMEFAAELARVETKQSLGGGLPPTEVGREKRPLVMIVCPNEIPNEAGLRSLRHLGHVVRVTATVGPLNSTNVISATPEVFVPDSVLAFAQGNVATLRDLEDKDLVYLMQVSAGTSIGLLSRFFADFLEAQVYSSAIAAPGEPIRVAVVHALDAPGRAMREVVFKTLKYNATVYGTARSAAENGTDFKTFDVGNFNDFVGNPNPQTRINQAITEVHAYRPHVVVIQHTPDRIAQTLVVMDNLWPAGVPKPIYVATNPQWSNFMVQQIGTRDPLRRRFYGLEGKPIGQDQAQKDFFELSLKSTFRELETQSIGIVASTAYESMYLLNYALAGVGPSPRGEALVRPLRLATSNGEIVKMGPDSMSKAVSTIAKGGGFVAQGPLGEIRFDDKGDRLGVAGIYCVGATAGRADRIIRPTYTVDPRTDQSTGTVAPCIPP